MNNLFSSTNRYRLLLCAVTFLATLAACRKLVEIDDPKNQLTPEKVYADTNAAQGVIANVYANYERNINPILNLSLALYADELNYFGLNTETIEFFQSRVSTGNQRNQSLWARLYNMVYQCNDLLEKLPVSENLPDAFRKRVAGEAHFLRAFAYFHLINLYENIPIILATDVAASSKTGQSNLAINYAQIEADLQSAQSLLNDYPLPHTKTRASYYSATALLSKVYLYQQQWPAAAEAANIVINSNLFKLEHPAEVFKASSAETIFQFWTPQGYNYNTPELILTNTNNPQYALNTQLGTAFETDDLRKEHWVGIRSLSNGSNTQVYFYPIKYSNTAADSSDPEYFIYSRLADQYLILAEAKAELGDFDACMTALNVLRERANIQTYSNLSSIELCREAVTRERRLELFLESGDRLFDLKRTGKLNEILKAKPLWLPRARNLPIPRNELSSNRSLIQNDGY
ncbi:RagB/SusD family nutrient uptake outer membrane protein [Pedobacter deserti]|uniref:RagB/SusD family nutrient uptake outer membrane protein n=1 Tax=Pedobacter deserti TaxID=2817382 RepID=UPI00210AD1C9|nr:RagB/SusD family nutrient uptake outer membrane protein [Pedobacter sp. SYSU D00382]